VLTELPGNNVDVVPVGIHSLARIGIIGPERSQSRDANFRKTKIIGGGIGGARAYGVQADAGWG
jgi:hypothetical protein